MKGVPRISPSRVDSIIIDFSTLQLTPLYMKDDSAMDINVKVSFGRHQETQSISTDFSNGDMMDLSGKMSPVLVDESSFSDTAKSADGEIIVTLKNSDIQSTYIKNFSISEANIYLESSTCDDPGYCGSLLEYNGTTIRSSRGLNLYVLDSNNIPVFWGAYDVHAGTDYRYSTSFNNKGGTTEYNYNNL